jgi:hypothetical protein
VPEPSAELLGAQVRFPDHIVFQEIEGEAALLNLHSELYFGLDDVGTRMSKALTDADTVASAIQSLQQAYDAPPDRIRDDVLEFLQDLMSHGLVEVAIP